MSWYGDSLITNAACVNSKNRAIITGLGASAHAAKQTASGLEDAKNGESEPRKRFRGRVQIAAEFARGAMSSKISLASLAGRGKTGVLKENRGPHFAG
jgi:hypothetical protein